MRSAETFYEVFVQRQRILFNDLDSAKKCASRHGAVVREITENVVFDGMKNPLPLKVESRYRNGKLFQYEFTDYAHIDRYLSDFLDCNDSFILRIYKV